MKKFTVKRALSMLLALIMVIGLLPATALAAPPNWASSANLVIGILNDDSLAGEGQFPNEPSKVNFDFYYLHENSGSYSLGTDYAFGSNTFTSNASNYINLDVFWADERLVTNAGGNVAGIYDPNGLSLTEEPWFAGKTLIDETKILTEWMDETNATGNVDDYELLVYVLKYEDNNYGWLSPDSYHLDMKVVKKANVTLAYDINKPVNTSVDIEVPANSSVPVGTSVTVDDPKQKTITVDGIIYEFTGWNTAKDGTGASYVVDEQITVSADTVLYAQWRIANTYTVTWRNHNDVVLELDVNIPYGVLCPSYDGDDPTKASDNEHTYTFTGWSEGVYADGSAYDPAVGVVGNLTYTAQFESHLILHSATVDVVLNGNFDADGNRDENCPGELKDINTMVSSSDGRLFLKKKGAADVAANYLELTKTATGSYTKAEVPNGEYYIYLYDMTKQDYVQVGTQELIIANADRTRYLPYYSVTYHNGEAPDDGENKVHVPATQYYYIGSDVTVAAAPVWSGYQFLTWAENSNTYTPGTTINTITEAYELTAQWEETVNVNVVVNVAHGNDDHYYEAPLDVHLTHLINGEYREYPGSLESSANWHNPVNGVTTYELSGKYVGLDDNLVIASDGTLDSAIDALDSTVYPYSAHAALAGYAHKQTVVEYNPLTNTFTVTIDLEFDPDGFELEFEIRVDPETPAELLPGEVDVKILYWDNDSDSWKPISEHEHSSMAVAIDKEKKTDGTLEYYYGEGSHHVWGLMNDNTTPYLYRIELVDLDAIGASVLVRDLPLSVTMTSSDKEAYTSSNSDAFPAGAYTGNVYVVKGDNDTCGTTTGGALEGAHAFKDGTYLIQHDTVYAMIDVTPYHIVLDENYAGGDETLNEFSQRFTVPDLNNITPARDGYTFDGWYAKDSGGNLVAEVTGGEYIKQLDSNLALGGTLTLYAKWKEDFTVNGTVIVDLGFPCTDESRTVTVALQMRRGESTYNVTAFSKTIALHPAEGNPQFASGTYSFTDVPDIGEYRVYVVVPAGGTVKYQNEPASLNGDNLYKLELYSDSTEADKRYYIANRGETDTSVATVNIYMDATEFDMGYMVDASAIGQGFRPTTIDLDLRHDHRKTELVEGVETVTVSYETIKDDIAVNNFTNGISGITTISVPPYHANGYLYDYVISVLRYTIPEMDWTDRQYYHYESATPGSIPAPFTIHYTGPANFTDDPEKTTKVTVNGNTVTYYQDVMLKAIFEPNKYDISYELNGGRWLLAEAHSVPSQHTWSFDTEIPVPVRDRYIFTGWTVTTASGADISDKISNSKLSAAVWEDITLTANWEPEYIQINPDGGIWNDSTAVVDVQWTGIEPLAPSKAFHLFEGWIRTDGGTALDGNKTIKYTYTAYWVQPDTLTYTVHHVEKTADGQPEHVLYEETIVASDENLVAGDSVTSANKQRTFPGYTYDSAEQETLTLNFTDKGNGEHDYSDNLIILYYTKNVYTLTYLNSISGDKPASSTIPSPVSNIGYNDSVSLTAATTEDRFKGEVPGEWTFLGWADSSGSLVTKVENITDHVNVYAKWSFAPDTYTVTWVDEDGSELEMDENVTYGTTPSYDGETPTKESTAQYTYTHNGWTPQVTAVIGNVTYTATYTQTENKYTVTWVNEDGTELEKDENVTYGATPSYDGETPTKDADAQYTYTFDKWNPDIYAVGGDVTYTATYTQTENMYTVTYDLNGGSSAETLVYERQYGAATPTIANPTRSGYTFTSWNPSVADTVDGNVTYVAQWSQNSPPPIVPTTGSAQLIKVDANDPSTRLDKATFRLYLVSGSTETLMGSYTTNTDGLITVSALAPGNYYWRELRAPEGYKLDATKHQFTVVAGQNTQITVANTHSAVPDVFTDEHYAYIVGYADGKVHPERNITRAEVATIFFRLLNEDVRSEYLTNESSFTDVAEKHWFNLAVSTMAAMGVINGYPDNTFKPNAPITRAEFASICARFDKYSEGSDASFGDVYGHWAEDEIAIAVSNGWLMGYDDGTFHPRQNITRAEAILVINRVLQRIPGCAEDLLLGMIIWPDNTNLKSWYYLAIQEATNSHSYDCNTNGREYWISLTETPDWTKIGQ